MKSFGLILLGVIIGAALTVGGYFGYGYFSGKMERENYHYFDVEVDKNIVTLHTGMSRDSVAILLGIPASSSSSNVNGEFRENLKYNLNGGLSPDLELTFVDGKLKEYNHNEKPDVFKSLEKGMGTIMDEIFNP